MRNLPPVLLLGILVLALGTSESLPCGDKFLVVGSGVAYQRAYAAPHPASILIYMNPDSDVQAAIRDVDLRATLGVAGHTFQVVEHRDALDASLKDGRFDIVLVDLDDAAAMEAQVRSLPGRPAVLPVIYNPSKETLSAARAQYGQILKAPARTGHLLAVINRAMEERIRSGKPDKPLGR